MKPTTIISDSEMIMINSGEFRKIRLDDIIYLSTGNHRMLIHTVSGEYSAHNAIGDFSLELLKKGFFRVRNNVYANMKHVLSITEDKEVLLDCGVLLKLSQSSYQEIHSLLSDLNEKT